MPTCRRKRVVLTEPSAALHKALKTNPDKDVFFLHQTGEVFDTYEQYAARMSFYRQKQFQCEVTGKSGLDYFQAVESELQEGRILHHRFPEPLKAAVLKSVQYQVVGRLDHLVEAVFERFKDRYFKDEKILVDLGGVKYGARVEKVFTPKYNQDTTARDTYKPSTPGGKSSEFPEGEDPPHAITGDLKEPAKDANARDDPKLYYYWVHILEFERGKGDSAKAAAKDSENGKMIDSIREVQCEMMSRDRLSFSKSILRRFIRDCVDRDAAVASPWTVKPAVANHHGIHVDIPVDKRKSESNKKFGDSDKRKKVWEDKELPPTKRQKKMMEVQEEKERQATERAEKQRQMKEEAVLASPEKKKKKPVRYPTEDLDVHRIALPFNDSAGNFEAFLMTWIFLVVYGNALHISTMTLDEFEHAIQHSVQPSPCPLLAEVHTALIHVLRTVPFMRHNAVLSLISPENGGEETMYGVSVDELTAAINEHGVNWERAHLKQQDGREGWEDALFGCLKDASPSSFPIFPHLIPLSARYIEQLPDSSSGSDEASICSRSSRRPCCFVVECIPGILPSTSSKPDGAIQPD
ncbi:ATP-utilizing chromatin assembly and remodelling N-terminal-domain-containing protein [Mycena amicta]|nr:ATP-utilizing chromatin assembly and remodelling N-terminal-domain-containing protein [Mycena amicta]